MLALSYRNRGLARERTWWTAAAKHGRKCRSQREGNVAAARLQNPQSQLPKERMEIRSPPMGEGQQETKLRSSITECTSLPREEAPGHRLHPSPMIRNQQPAAPLSSHYWILGCQVSLYWAFCPLRHRLRAVCPLRHNPRQVTHFLAAQSSEETAHGQ